MPIPEKFDAFRQIFSLPWLTRNGRPVSPVITGSVSQIQLGQGGAADPDVRVDTFAGVPSG